MTLFRVGGVPIVAHWTLIVLLTAFAAWVGAREGVVGAVHALALVAALLGSVLWHEGGHAWVATRLGLRIESVLLLPFGGATRVEHTWVTPRVDAVVSAAGPAASLLLGAVALGVGRATAWRDAEMIGWVNLGLGVFNLLPAFPMDGGRVLRAALVGRMGLVRATSVALSVGFVLAVAMAAVGMRWRQPEPVIVALFLVVAQRREWVAVRQLAEA
jgi:Zn-dependent protease